MRKRRWKPEVDNEDEHGDEVEELPHEGELDLGEGIEGLRGPEADLEREDIAPRS